MKRILITGSNGQLGKELNNQLSSKKFDVILTDINEMDITNFAEVSNIFHKEKPQIIINCAAHTSVDLCEDNHQDAYLINSKGVENIAIASSEINAKLVQISTDYVFDGKTDKPYTENDKPNPQSIYGKTKLEGELFAINHSKKHFIIRTAWLYGDGKNFVRTMIALSKKRDSIKVVNDQIGSPTSTKELSKAIIRLMETDLYGTYHATCEGQCTWYDFAKKTFEYSNIKTIVIPCTSKDFIQKAKRPSYSVLENRNFKKRLNYEFAKWQDALKEFIIGEKT